MMNRSDKNTLIDEVRELFALADEMLDTQAESGNAFGGHDIHDRLIMSSIISQTRLQSMATRHGEQTAPQAMPPVERRPGNPVRPKVRVPKLAPGAEVLVAANKHNDVPTKWIVQVIYADLYAAVDSFVVPPDWFDAQAKSPIKPSTKDQIFYGLMREDGMAAILVGENELQGRP
jgi:hypothetical protein